MIVRVVVGGIKKIVSFVGSYEDFERDGMTFIVIIDNKKRRRQK